MVGVRGGNAQIVVKIGVVGRKRVRLHLFEVAAEIGGHIKSVIGKAVNIVGLGANIIGGVESKVADLLPALAAVSRYPGAFFVGCNNLAVFGIYKYFAACIFFGACKLFPGFTAVFTFIKGRLVKIAATVGIPREVFTGPINNGTAANV